jgi:hypothetical protein
LQYGNDGRLVQREGKVGLGTVMGNSDSLRVLLSERTIADRLVAIPAVTILRCSLVAEFPSWFASSYVDPTVMGWYDLRRRKSFKLLMESLGWKPILKLKPSMKTKRIDHEKAECTKYAWGILFVVTLLESKEITPSRLRPCMDSFPH